MQDGVVTGDQCQALHAGKVRVFDGHDPRRSEQLLWVVVYQLPEGGQVVIDLVSECETGEYRSAV